MKRFRIITAICLTAITLKVAGNVWYLYSLYNSIKQQTLLTVRECVRRADILEIISRMKGTSLGDDDSFIILSLKIEGEKSPTGEYDYPNLLDNVNQTMSRYFHFVEEINKDMPKQNDEMLDRMFRKELNNVGLYPTTAFIRRITDESVKCEGLWSVDFALGSDQEPVYRACFTTLNGHILRQMAGIIITSAMILILMGFLIWYLLRQVGKLRTIEQMKDDFTHNMTHELKTPVAVAYSAADSMLRYYDQSNEERNKQFLKIILQRLSFLSGMIENILSMSMERFKSMKLNIERVELRPLVEEIVGMIELKADKPMAITIDIPDGMTVMTDSLHFGNVISNLIDNSIKYSGESVNITVKADGDSIEISDDGIGIDKENLPYIFDKFYRVAEGDRYEVGGYGLGLFYVKQILELQGWDIEVESKRGKGTKFIIKLRK
ncbi:MAG: HAMP domain-containing histidine kinase [Muribaculaceae bacterium]|nr:HAMP domain-containing histidine kinase [Muribaculaceae bacterium]